MKFPRSALPLVGILLSGVALASGQHADHLSKRADEASATTIIPGAYIVEWADDSQDSSAFYAELQTEGIQVSHRMDLQYKLFKGASFQVLNVAADQKTTAKLIGDKTGVRGLWPVQSVPAPKLTTATDSPVDLAAMLKRRDEDKFSPHIMTQVDKLHAEGINGTGVKIGIVDTGCDWTHPALGGCFGPGCLVGYGWDLVGDALVDPVPDPYPQDCIGHGTHVAGIIAAQPNVLDFTGTAPGATLGCYRVFGCGDSGDDDVLVAGFLKAFDDGSDIISCSAGTDSGWSTDLYATTVQRIVDAGVPVVVAIGNDGNLGLWTTATPASAPGVVAVGAVNNYILPLLTDRATFTINGSDVDFGWYLASVPDYTTFGNATMEVWFPPSGDNACDPLPDSTPDLSDKLVVVHLDGATDSACTTVVQGTNIVASGGRNVMYYSTDYSDFRALSYVTVDGLNGAGSTYGAVATEWMEALNSGEKVVVTFNSSAPQFAVNTPAPFGNMTARLGSWGPTFDLELKPQITAPGIDILSTYPVDSGSYAVLPGTSMATPLISAVYALILQARGIKDPKTLSGLISSTGKPQVWWDGTTVHDLPAPVPQQGAGLVQAFDALHATTFLSVSSFAFNDTDHFVGTYTFSVNNTASESVEYTLGHSKATTVTTFADDKQSSLSAATYPPPTVEAWADISFDANTITVPAGASVDVTFTVTLPQDLNSTLLPVYSGYITLEGSNGETPSIPYLGVAGSMRSTPVINGGYPRSGANVYLTDNNGHFNIPRDANTTFTIPRADSNSTASAIYPKLSLNMNLGTKKLRVDIVALTETGLPVTAFFNVHSIGLASKSYPSTYMPKVGGSLLWGGTLAGGTVVPEGTYVFATSALRIFGDESKEEDWDFVETFPFIIKYLE